MRRKKARIRREVFNMEEQEKQIQELYQKIFKNLKINGNINKAVVSNK